MSQHATGNADHRTGGVEEAPSIFDLLTIVRTHGILIAVCALAGAVLAGAYTVVRTPVFQAATTLRIDPSRAGSLGVSEPGVADAVNETAVIQTEMGIVASDGVTIRALQAISARRFAKLCGYEREGSWFAARDGVPGEREEQTLAELRRATDVTLLDGTKLVRISVTHHDRQAAAAWANALVTAYEQQGVDSRTAAVEQLSTWLTAQMAELAGQGAVSQQKLASFERSHDILATDGTSTTVNDRLRMLNERLTTTESDRIVKEGQMHAAEAADPDALASLFGDPKLAELQRQHGVAEAELARLSAKFGDAYPPLADVKQQLARIQQASDTSAQGIRRRLRQEVDAARDAEANLRRRYDQQTEMAYAVTRNQQEYQALQAEVSTGRELYNSLRTKRFQAAVEAGVRGVNVTLIDQARPPRTPVGLPRVFLLVGGMLVGMFAGVATAVGSDALRKSGAGAARQRSPVMASVRDQPITVA